jgi:alpha-beta hydrolase superfamily lysophospholipase
MIEEVGREERGPLKGRRVAIPGGGTRASDAPWQRSEIVFSVAVGVIAIHAFSVMPALVLAGIAAGIFRHARKGTRTSLLLLIGTWATIAGLGITAGHIWKMGLHWSDAIGVASLLSGLILLTMGTASVVRGIPGWRRLLVIPTAVIAIFYVFAPVTIAVYMTHVPPTMLGGNTPADRGFAYRDVAVSTTDGVELSGWYVPSRNRAALVVIHGSGSTRLNILDHVDVLASAGYGVVALDARGHGESEGRAMDLGWQEDLDIRAGVSFLAEQPDVDPDRIGTFGISMGAVGALEAAASDRRIAAVVSEGASVHSFDDALTLGVDGWWHLPFYWMTTTAADLLSPADPPMPIEVAMRRIGPRPVLLISGRGRDEGILNRRYAAAGSPRTELLELPDTKHSQGVWRHADEWSRRVIGFLDRALLG